MKRFDVKWLWLAGFVAIYLALRVFWLTCDTGVPATWEFGFHTTDEGYYLGGGKEMYLWGSFVDLLRKEALNYCYSYGTHWLSYVAHLCFGLSTWAWRIPFVALYFIAWVMMFGYVSRHSGAPFAFATCLAASSLPLVVTYERGMSNDATIAALVAIAFALAAGKGVWRIFAAALVTSTIATVKPAVWVMIPVVLAALLEERKTRSRLLDAAIYVVLAVALVYGWKGLSALTVLGVAAGAHLTPWQVLARVNATYGLPSIADIAQDFRALASFPRDPSVRVMGPAILMISVVPATLFLFNLLRRKFNARLLLYFMMALYAYALNVINSMYTHYFLPLLILLPALFSCMRDDFAQDAGRGVLGAGCLVRGERRAWCLVPGASCGVPLLLIVAASGVAALFLASAPFNVNAMAPLYSRIHNLPQMNPWRVTWTMLTIGTLLGVAFLAACRGLGALRREGWAWAIGLFLTFSIVLAALPAAVLAPRMRLNATDFYAVMALNLAFGLAFLFLVFARSAALARAPLVAGLLVVPVLIAYVALPTWRQAAVELVTRRAHYDAYLAGELKKLLPENAIVLGERSAQALMSLPIRPATTFLDSSNPIPIIENVWKKDPTVPLYALVDAQCTYNLQHFRKHAKEYRLDVVKQFKMPSFSNGKLADLWLCRVVRLRP